MTYTREATVEARFTALAKAHGWRVRKLAWIGRRGAPDRLIMKWYQRVVFVELKAPKGVLEDHQVREHARLRDMGFQVEVLWNKQLVKEFFDADAQRPTVQAG